MAEANSLGVHGWCPAVNMALRIGGAVCPSFLLEQHPLLLVIEGEGRLTKEGWQRESSLYLPGLARPAMKGQKLVFKVLYLGDSEIRH